MTGRFECTCPIPNPAFTNGVGDTLCGHCGGFTQAATCRCNTPEPKHTENGIHICARCGARLPVDERGRVYRERPGDLDGLRERVQRAAKDIAGAIKDDMAAFVATLPEHEQARLMRMSQRSPRRFQRVAKEMLATRDRMQAADAARGGPPPLSRNEIRRRLREWEQRPIDARILLDDLLGAETTHGTSSLLSIPADDITVSGT